METVAQIRVLYADTDQMKVVNNVVYLRWFEIGRAEWLRKRGSTYKEVEKTGFQMPVVEAFLKYREPALYDDLVDVEVETDDLRAASIKFKYVIRRAGTLLCDGYTMHACLTAQGKVSRFPDSLLNLL